MKAIIDFFTRNPTNSQQKEKTPLPVDWDIEQWAEKSHQELSRLFDQGKISDRQASEFTSAIDRILNDHDEGAGSNLSIWRKMLVKIQASLKRSNALKIAQQIVLAVGVLWILIVLLQPPYLSEETLRGGQGQILVEYRTPIGHYWIWKPPAGVLTAGANRFQTSEPCVDIQRLLIYLGIGVVVISFGMIMLRQPRDRI